MKNSLIITFLLVCLNAIAQKDAYLSKADLLKELRPLQSEIEILQSKNRKLTTEVKGLTVQLSTAKDQIDSLGVIVTNNSSAIIQAENQLGKQITTTKQEANIQIDQVGQSLSRKSVYGIVGVLLAILISGLLYWLLSKRQVTDRANIIDLLGKTKSSIEDSLIKEFGKQTELMNSQLNLIEQNKGIVQSMPNLEPDHSLALKLASEINLIERNINLMDSKTKGLKQLQASIGKLKDNLSANGYEMPVLLGKPFNQGMRVIVATSIPDENLEKGQEVITKILIPQVNYNDKMIQTAQIEVSVGY